MHRHFSTGSTTLSALMAARRDEPRRLPAYDLFRLLAEMGDRGHRVAHKRSTARPVARPGEPRDVER